MTDSPAKTTAPGAQAGMKEWTPPGTNMLTVSDHKLMLDAYRGSGGFKDGNYLVSHRREDQRDYDIRRQVAHYDNFVRPIIDAHVDPIFRKQINRTPVPKHQEYFDALSKDIDKGGTGINDFMRRAAVCAQRDSIAFIAVSAPTDAPADASEELAKRPWAYMIQTVALKGVPVRDEWGRCTSVSWAFEQGGKPYVRTLTGLGWETVDDHGHRVEDMSGAWKEPRETAPVVMLVPHGWDDDEQMPTPRFFGVAKANHRVFNQTSELDEIERNATFPMLTYPSSEPGSLTIGTNNVMGYPRDATHAPAWISPDGAAAVTLANGIERNMTAIYRMANLSHALTDGSTQQSGVAKQLDRAAFDDSLSSFGEYLSDAEQKLWALVAWISGKDDLAASVSYPTEFTSAELDTELAAVASALQLGAGETFAQHIRKRVARLLLPDASPEVLAQIDKEIEQQADADNQDKSIPPRGDEGGTQDDEDDEGGQE